jgi:RNA polymerase sigma-70 factor (ECF subfamily)
VGDDAYPDWEAVYQDNVDRVYGMMFAKVGNRADAEDLTAEVFLAALGPLRVSASVGEVRAYLSATARTVLAGHWRRHYGREITVLAELPDVAEPVTDGGHRAGWTADADEGADEDPSATSGGAAAAEAADLLAKMPEKYGQVLRLRFLQGYSVRDTATALGISVGNAKVLQHRALRRAAQLMEEVAP